MSNSFHPFKWEEKTQASDTSGAGPPVGRGGLHTLRGMLVLHLLACGEDLEGSWTQGDLALGGPAARSQAM